MAAGRWSEKVGFVTVAAVLVAIVAVDLAFGPALVLSGSYSVSAVLAAVVTTVRRTAAVAAVAVVLSALSGAWNANFWTADWGIRLAVSAALAALAILSAHIRVRRERALRHMTVIAETAQRAVLRAMPSRVGSLGFAARYVSATREALVGGDLYEVVESPFGVRVVVGDVRGKGLDAVQMAGTVMGAFRRAAFTQPSLVGIAKELDSVVSAVAGDEDFVTAVLAEFHDDATVTLVNCGHHQPLLVNPSESARLLQTGEPVPPLGLGPSPSEVSAVWPEGSRMLMYTDGLVEARNRRGVFFPLTDYAMALCHGTLDDALERLLKRLTAHAGSDIADDMALVLVEHRAAQPSPAA